MQQNGQKDQPAQPIGKRKSRPDRHAIEERMHAQAAQHRVARVRGDKFAAVRLFAVVKVRVDRVLQQVHRAITGHDQHRAQLRLSRRLSGVISSSAVAIRNPAPSATK